MKISENHLYIHVHIRPRQYIITCSAFYFGFIGKEISVASSELKLNMHRTSVQSELISLEANNNETSLWMTTSVFS